jgi:4-amino-4-deoxy-L-arabinose transferase-like glycosyltransferase
LFYYLGTLTVVYLLGREIFNERAGLVAAAMVGLWPSFLLHSTQQIRDPLAILCLLALLLVLTLLVSRDLKWKPALALGVGGAALTTVFWLARGNMWNVVLVAVALALVMLAFRMIRERKFMAGNAIVLLSIIVAMLFVPSRLESTTLAGVRPPATPLAIPSASQPATRDGVWTRAINQIRDRRAGFRFYTAQKSNIRSDVQFQSVSDVIRFIPSAAVVGFFAPFPRMWFEAGTYGAAGRLLTGAETLVMYFLYVAVGVCLWKERRRLAMWLIFLTATAGLIGLGLVVVNAGALYRIRYVFWIMLIVIAAQGVIDQFELRASRKGAKAPKETQ